MSAVAASAAASAATKDSKLPPNTVLEVSIGKIWDGGFSANSTLFSTYEAASQFIVRQFAREYGGIKQYYKCMKAAYEHTGEVIDDDEKVKLTKVLSAKRAAKRFSPDALRAIKLSVQMTKLLYGIEDVEERPHYTISLMYRRIHEDGDFDNEYNVLCNEESDSEDEE